MLSVRYRRGKPAPFVCGTEEWVELRLIDEDGVIERLPVDGADSAGGAFNTRMPDALAAAFQNPGAIGKASRDEGDFDGTAEEDICIVSQRDLADVWGTWIRRREFQVDDIEAAFSVESRS